MVTFLFSVHTIIEAKQYAGLARAVDLPARIFDLARPGVAPPLLLTYADFTHCRYWQ